MANYFVSYDLNGAHPTHDKMDEHLKKLGRCVARVLETVWYVKTKKTEEELFEYVDSICSANDRVLVTTASSTTYRNLIPPSYDVLDRCWKS